MKHYTFYPQGVCSTRIDLDIDAGAVHNVAYTDGCDGNLKALGALVEGMKVDDVIKRLHGIRCGQSNTSCSDQLARALMSTK
ncbi:MAG: TIGR03905 family TSCPD domain-containing protein [Clostridia bacterium]